MGEIIELESVMAKGDVAHDITCNELDGRILAGGVKMLNASVREAVEDSLLLMLDLVGLNKRYGNWSALRDNLPEDLEFEIGESLRFLKDVRLVQLRKNISALESVLERFTTGRKVPIPSLI